MLIVSKKLHIVISFIESVNVESLSIVQCECQVIFVTISM